MRKHLLSALLMLLCGTLYSQITGIKTIPGDYASIQAAITALNTEGVGLGGVTFNVAAGHTETFTLATAGTITATGTSTNPIVFQKSGTGNNPKIIAFTGTGIRDGFIKLSGTDYITFDGIDLQEAAANNNSTKQIEWGYALVKKSSSAPIDGCSFVVIKNCNIILTQANTNTRGIYVAHHTATSTSLPANPTTLSDVHSNCSFYSNTISNCNIPISLVGYNAPSPYTLFDQNMMVGVNGGNTISNFAGGKGIYTKYQYNVQIANNNITETVGSNSTIYGIHVDVALRAPATINANTISLKNGLGIPTTIYGIACGSGSSVSGNTCVVTIANNTIQNCSFGYNGSTGFYGITMESSPDTVYFTNNQILNNAMQGNGPFYGIATSHPLASVITGNTIAGNSKTGNYGYLYGIRAGNSKILCDDNAITNNTFTISAGTSVSYMAGYYNDVALNQEIISNNTISGLSMNGIGGTMSVDGIYATYDVSRTIYNNNVNNLIVTSGKVYGINVPTSASLDIHHNQVYGLTNETGASDDVAARGIYVNTFDTLNLHNNFISDINAPQANSAHAIVGLYIGNNPTFGQIAYVRYNTIFLNASSSGALFGTSAFYCAYAGISNYLSLTSQNNIFIDKSTPNDWGKAVAFRRGGVNTLSFNELSDNNNLYAGTPGPNNLIYDDGLVSNQTIAEYKAWVNPREQHSISENTVFVNTLAKPYDLHVDASVATQCESAALQIFTPSTLDYDFDYNLRYPNPGYPDLPSSPAIKPDMGADEFAGTHLDLEPPSISYTPLPVTGYPGNRTLTATITDDYSGVPVSGIGLPMLYWKINMNGSWLSTQSTFVSADTYSFTFGDGAVDGDTVFYYIVAQDMAVTPNAGASPSYGAEGFSINPPECAVAPDPDLYRVLSMCGTYYVGAGQDFEDIEAAISKLDQCELTCPVVLLLTDSINASLSHTLYPFYGSSATNTVTIKPAPTKNVVLTAFSFGGVFNFVGTSNFIIDGSNLENGNTHNLFINNLDGTGAPVIKFSALESQHSTNITIKNCNLIGGGSDYSSFGVLCNNAEADSINIINNRFWNLVVGIEMFGSSTDPMDGCTISKNTFGSAIDTLRLSKNAINVMFTNGLVIQDNLITNLDWNESSPIGLIIGQGNTNTQVVGNNLTGIKYSGSFNYGAIGIQVQTQLSNSEILIANNILSDIGGTGSTEPEYYGICGINISYTQGIKVLHNSINLYGDIYGTQNNQYSAAIFLGLSTENLTMVNNILRNTLNDVNYTTAKAYALYSQADSWMQTQMDYNCYYTTGDQGVMAFVDGSEYWDLATLSADIGTDSFSIASDPMFSSPITLVPAFGSPVLGAGTPLAEVPLDYLGLARSLTNPSIGAYEYGGGSTDKNLLVTVLLEGLYEGSGLMRKASIGNIPLYLGLVADEVTIELHDALDYTNIVYSTAANLTTAGTVSLVIPSTYNQQYYITLKHRTHLDITSFEPISFEFDLVECLMTSPFNVYSGNLKQSSDGFWMVFGGDINQDGFVDETDMDECNIAVGAFGTGIVSEDVDCNGVLDAHDLIIIDNNAALSAQNFHP